MTTKIVLNVVEMWYSLSQFTMKHLSLMTKLIGGMIDDNKNCFNVVEMWYSLSRFTMLNLSLIHCYTCLQYIIGEWYKAVQQLLLILLKCETDCKYIHQSISITLCYTCIKCTSKVLSERIAFIFNVLEMWY